MKKLLAIAIISIGMAAALTGCQKGEPAVATPVIEEVTDAASSDAGQESTEEAEPATENETVDNDVSTTPVPDGMSICRDERLEYSDFGVDIPTSWRDTVYVIANDSCVSFYQKASWDVGEGMGFIVSLNRTDNMVPEVAGEVNWAYTPDFMYYYATPTDVPFDYENETTANEYSELAKSIPQLIKSWEIYEQDIHYDASEYVCPMSNFKPIPEEIALNLTKEQLLRAHNEIYARYGKEFDNVYTQWYFDSCSWYEASSNDVPEDVLTDTEKENLEIIKNAIVELNVNNAYPEKFTVGDVCQKEINLEWGIVDVEYSVEGSYEEGFDGILKLSDRTFSLKDDFGIELESPEGEYFFVTDINPYVDGLEIAVIDYGMDDNRGAYFFTQESDGAVTYIGYVPGCSFATLEQAPCDSFAEQGRVISVNRTNLLGSGSYFASVWYDGENHTFESNTYEGEMFDMVPSPAKVAQQNISGFVSEDSNELFPINEGETFYFVATDNSGIIKVKNMYGDIGFMTVSDEMSANPEAYFKEK